MISKDHISIHRGDSGSARIYRIGRLFCVVAWVNIRSQRRRQSLRIGAEARNAGH
jgi:hypothetical protein